MISVVLVAAILLEQVPSSIQSGSQCGQSSPCDQGFIINGVPSCRREFPWYAALVKPSLLPGNHQLKPFCGASIISSKFLISAGHCFKYSRGDSILSVDDFRVYPGFDDRSLEDPPYHYVKRIEIHEDWLQNTEKWDRGNDLALLELLDPINFSGYLSPICLPSVDQKFLIETGRDVKMGGFGSIKHFQDNYPNKLQKGNFNIVNCASKNNICADEVEKGKVISSTCRGDSGGGLVGLDEGSFFLVGVVSWGRQCGAVNFTTRYVNVFDHLEWINNRICLTEEGKVCILPFRYRRTSYSECLSDDVKYKASCPTKLDKRGEGAGWQFCDDQCPGFKEPVDGSFGLWSEWTPCSRTCGGGDSKRSRECNNPEPLHGGKVCEGDDEEAKHCNMQDCVIEDTSAEITPIKGSECESVTETCMNIEWLRSHNKCEKLVKIYDDVNLRNDESQLETIFSKTCSFDPYGVCCMMDITVDPDIQGCSAGEEYGGICYLLVESPKTWSNAAKDCIMRNGTLASVSDTDANNFIGNLAQISGFPSWIGATDAVTEGVWKWTDGRRVSFANWFDDNPNNYGGNQNCVAINFGGTGKWDDDNCETPKPYICQGKDLKEGKTTDTSDWVTCGSHKAPDCSLCPGDKGAGYCNGDCVWLDNSCQLYRSINQIEIWSDAQEMTWGDDQCPNVGNHLGLSVDECKEKCSATPGCSAINVAGSNKDCVLRGCSIPVAPPQINNVQYEGYFAVETNHKEPAHNLECGIKNNMKMGSSDQDSWPWLVNLGRLHRGKFQSICVGTILNENTILSVSSCFGRLTHVRVGASDFFVKDEIQHPDFSRVTSDNDIGIIKLSKSIIFNNYIAPACLPDAYKNEDLSSLLADNQPTFLWWKWQAGAEYTLQQAATPVVSHQECQEDWDDIDLDEGMVCAWYRELGDGGDRGDGGGPLMSMALGKAWSVVGILSLADVSVNGGQFPDIYSRVDHYLDWIRKFL